MKLAVVIGHNSQAQGAVRKDTNQTEYVWNGQIAQMMADKADHYGIELKIFRRVPSGGYGPEIRRVYDEVDRWNAAASMELHFNGAVDEAATGTEMLTSGTPLSMRFGAEVQAEVLIALGLRDRGVKTVGSASRGGKSLHSGKAPAILVEPFFGSSPKGLQATDERHEQMALADAYLRGAAVAFDSFPRRDLAGSRTLDAAKKQDRAAQGGILALVGSFLLPVLSPILGGAESVQGAVDAIQPLTQYFPGGGKILALVAIGFFIYSKWQTARIAGARLDAADRELMG